jgi:hypothetical protein
LKLPIDHPLVIRAVAEIALGVTIEIGGWMFSRISDTSVAISEPGDRETYFINLDTGTQR